MSYRDKTIRDLSKPELDHVIKTFVQGIGANAVLNSPRNELRVFSPKEFINALAISEWPKCGSGSEGWASKVIGDDEFKTLNGYSVFWQICGNAPKVWIGRSAIIPKDDGECIVGEKLIAHICATYNVALNESHWWAIAKWRLKVSLLSSCGPLIGLIPMFIVSLLLFGMSNTFVSIMGAQVFALVGFKHIGDWLMKRYGLYSSVMTIGYPPIIVVIILLWLIESISIDIAIVVSASVFGLYVSMMKYPYSGRQFNTLSRKKKLSSLYEMYVKTPAKIGVFTYAGVQMVKIAIYDSHSTYFIPAIALGLMVIIVIADFALDEYRADSWLPKEDMVEHPPLHDGVL